MNSKKYIATNFAYGTGPYLMTTKLAVAFNDDLEKSGKSRMGIIVPWVYGEKQRAIMDEEFPDFEKKGEIILDAKLGEILKKVFYENTDYATYLKQWTGNFKTASREANAYLTERYGKNIEVELNRSPRLLYGVAPAYSTTFGYLSRVFKEAAIAPANIDKVLLKKAEDISTCVEREQRITAVAYPGIFSAGDYEPTYRNEFLVPPISPMPESDTRQMEKGFFITKSGIPGLERLYKEAEQFGLKVYTNEDYSPAIITNPAILMHFARSGWASVWFSMLAEKPLVVPQYDSADDLEISFNNAVIEKLGIGVVYRGEPLADVLNKLEKAKEACHSLKKEILDKWGTLDGTAFSAALFVKDYLAL